ncbi:ribbon-helix-helix protein, CopG family [Azoarcus indigens]|uniref:Ribbon-helix-helix CopG family protein n=1 Tax=Azoarcus indigens TaxID=29545 RepID=A0A4R6DVJ4_9RHOO|nr:ribbon-helix-helix protein, CopG family [Azoarcus indigens]NMG64351.1 ribbon-helix-helix protein, CopG family [Azoarcus indigens]TDN49197.1 ribbon-helix-helix CopG family protein [Azoarcus indigens]
MSWLNPRTWFGRSAPKPDLNLSRRAVDSSDKRMDDVVTIRMPPEVKALLDRKARALGLSLSEYMRMKATIDDMEAEDIVSLLGLKPALVIRMADRLLKRGADKGELP